MAPNQWVRRVVVTLGSLALVATTSIVPAQAVDLEQVREQVMTLQSQAESAAEKYNDAQDRLRKIQGQLATLRHRLAGQRAELSRIRNSVDSLARATYAGGGLDTSLQVLLADNPTEFLSQASALDQVASSQAAAIRRTQTARLRLAQTEAAVQDKQAAAAKIRNEMRDAKREADDRLNQAQAVLNRLEAKELAKLNARAAAQRRAAQAAAAHTRQSFSTVTAAASGRAKAALRYALSQVGDRYVLGASGPSSFDCSGLMLTAWRQAGISLPRVSSAQYHSTKRISLSQARPGDLVFFFGGGVHHVGMYIGGGKMVHAANPGDGVTIDRVLGPWYNRYFTGVGRVAG